MLAPSLDQPEMTAYLERLLANHLPDGRGTEIDLGAAVAQAYDRVEHCFAGIRRKYYNVGGSIAFDHLNGDHMAAFLYFVANSAWQATGDTSTPTKLFGLNKIMHGLDLFYSVRMPEVFLLVHPVGSVIGNARYGEHLVVYQNCTVGADAGIYPTFGDGVILYSGVSVLGRSVIGDDVVFAARSFIVNADVPSHSVVVGQYPSHRTLENTRPVRQRVFEPVSG
jgi:serine O-acetyltransferase